MEVIYAGNDCIENQVYERSCEYCIYFNACPCGCRWGVCELDKDEMYNGTEQGCEQGIPYDGIYAVPADENYVYESYRDKQFD